MIMNNVLDIKDLDEFRKWLVANHDTEKECWITVKRGMPVDDGSTFWYVDAVEEAMCFGWIDGMTKKFEDGITRQRFVPRRKGSIWSELNKARCRRMELLGRMTEAGRAQYPTKEFEIMPEILEALKQEDPLWKNFNSFPELYRRVRIDTIQIKRNDPELFHSRLQKFIDATRRGEMYGQWNDNGRLLDI
ncbi:thymidylate synthase [Muribaculaceae bacterium Isolate-037 (Harlan)]|uniref:Thymidylate synthase n=1 Tax=Lepagella muris TaxID=3032870 RepID=A0AC61REX9_9BACT|nr:thymidylate synthase [Muribaculaceae bacterium Isolate-037 (Harlan)]TGY77655.1 thymidylate synthase [Lepagella muris]THG50603.1 thymidylate synthase [Bacteroidales bacterium]TKC58349.1 thymidylate synthase [Bacteroidales bacterium]